MRNRDKTRRERYDKKKQIAETYPISVAAVNFMCDGNLGYILRSAACFGAKCVHVIGAVPERSVLNASSGSLCDYVEIIQHDNPMDFLAHARQNDYKVISAELSEGAESIDSYNFNTDKHVCLVVGNEQTGVPIEILNNSEKIYIPMPGVGYCLNTSQTANILLYEFVKRHKTRQRFYEEWVNECNIHYP